MPGENSGKKSLEQMKRDIGALGRRLKNAKDQGRIDKDKIQELENELTGLQNRLTAKTREVERVRSQIEGIKRGREELLKEVQQKIDAKEAVLKEANGRIQALREEVEKLTSPPNQVGYFIEPFKDEQGNEDGTAFIYVNERKTRVNLHPDIDIGKLEPGQELILNDAFNVFSLPHRKYEERGEVATVDIVVKKGELLQVVTRLEETRIVGIAGNMRNEKFRPRDGVIVNRNGFVVARSLKKEVEGLFLEKVPDITYENIGGLDKVIELVRDEIELPYLYQELYEEMKLEPERGILLFGPPGCGKTLLAKALANHLSTAIKERTGQDSRAYFINIKGPELLDKYVGEAERKIREVFEKAKDKANSITPVIIFIDEADAILRTRGSGLSSDIESTIVPMFLAELDGLEKLRNVIVILASNRQDRIDGAVLRPGRVGVHSKIDRPDKEAAKKIFKIYLTSNLPFNPERYKKGERHEYTDYFDPKGPTKTFVDFNSDEDIANYFIRQLVEELFFKNKDEASAAIIPRVVKKEDGQEEIKKMRVDNRFIDVIREDGQKETFYFSDFISGASIESIVKKMKQRAIKEYHIRKTRGKKVERPCLEVEHGYDAIAEEFRNLTELPDFSNPDDWAKIHGKGGKKVMRIISLQASSVIRVWSGTGKKPSDKIENLSTRGDYL